MKVLNTSMCLKCEGDPATLFPPSTRPLSFVLIDPFFLFIFLCIYLCILLDLTEESFSMNFDQFITIYPSYLDATKTIKQGRRIPKDLAVPTPTVSDMSLILQRHNYRHVLQPYKGYSRDSSTLWNNPGRVKVDCSTPKKMELLKLLATEIPDLPERQARLAQEAKEKELEEQKALEEANQARRLAEAKKVQQAAQSSKGSSNNKKKGKKKR